MKIILATPERKLYDNEDISKLVIQTVSGEITILPGHSPLMSSIGRGEAKIFFSENKSEEIFISGGVIQVASDVINILANVAEKAHEIDEAVIQESIRRAQLKAEEKTEEIDLAEIQAKLANDIARLKLISKYKAKNPRN